MSKNKLLFKEKVLTCGTGSRCVVLDTESGLAYQRDNPENVTAAYESGKGWIIRDRPHYNSGGWGKSASGDAEGYYLIDNTRKMLESVDAWIYEINSFKFFSPEEFKTIEKSIREHNRLVKSQQKLSKTILKTGATLTEVEELPSIKLRFINKGKSRRGIDPVKIGLRLKNALEVFISQVGKTVKTDSFLITKNRVIQHVGGQVKNLTVAFRDKNGDVFMNSQMLPITDFEKNFMGGQSLIQSAIRKVSKYNIPFNVLSAAGLKLSETKVLEQGPESTHTLNDKTERHFTGALLLENTGRKFLMDIDRQEIKYGIFNAFFVEVDKNVISIALAYESMKPEEVRIAEKQGLDVKRQGEWFFIPTGKTLEIESNKVFQWKYDDVPKQVSRFEIAHGKGRPNTLYKPVGYGDLDQYVCGTVKHTGREHQDLDLGQKQLGKGTDEDPRKILFTLYKVVGNTTVGNFTIKGDID